MMIVATNSHAMIAGHGNSQLSTRPIQAQSSWSGSGSLVSTSSRGSTAPASLRLVGAEAPQVALRVTHAEVPRTVILVFDRPDDHRAGRLGALVQRVRLIAGDV